MELTVRDKRAVTEPRDLQDLLRKLDEDIIAGMVWSTAAIHELGPGKLQPTGEKHVSNARVTAP